MAKRKPWRIEFTFRGEPLTKSNAHGFFRGKVSIPARIRNYEAALKAHAIKVMRRKRRRITGKLVKIKIVYYVGSLRRKDLLNLPKTTCDALNEACYRDDFQIHAASIKRRLDRKNPRVHIIIEETRDPDWERG
jgi:Holliday junction resolvase RusA-like endonuclease